MQTKVAHSDNRPDAPGNAKVPCIDPYFALLDRPGLRIFGIEGAAIGHRTALFDRCSYQSSTGMIFESDEEAYLHWLTAGRREGYQWADGKDTMLKIVLKARDEFELIDIWIEHHAKIVGYENLIVMDCGSTDPRYFERLAHWSDKVLVLKYWSFFTDIHSASWNRQFFELLAENCRYISILDADEFLLARSGDEFSCEQVKRLLSARQLDVFCGTWVNAACLSWCGATSISLSLDISPDLIRAGSFAGKSIVSTRKLFDCEHIGHNLHHPRLFEHVSAASFGELVVVHITGLPATLIRARTLRKLISHAGITAKNPATIEPQVRQLAAAPETPSNLRDYAQLYLSTFAGDPELADPSKPEMTIDPVDGGVQIVPRLASILSNIDFERLIAESLPVSLTMSRRTGNMQAQ